MPCVRIAVIAAMFAGLAPRDAAAQAPGGIVESATSTGVRPKPASADLATLLPARGRFTFPAPYNTTGVRLTNVTDCAGATDCVSAFAASGWPMMNNSAGSNFLYIGLTLDRTNGGVGPAIFRYNKTTGETVNLGPLFDAGDARSWLTTDGWYFSGSQPTTVYLASGPELQRYDILSHDTSVVFDMTAEFGEGTHIYYPRSSRDDRVHSFMVMPADGTWPTECGVYREATHAFTRIAAEGTMAMCEIDKSGQWLLMKEDRTGSGAIDNRIIFLPLGTESVLLADEGGAAMSDLGFGMMVAADATHGMPNALRTRTFDPLLAGPVVYHSLPGLPPSMTQISFSHARSAALDQQYVCGGAVNRLGGPRANEIVCARLDGSLTTLAVAPVMTDLDARGGGPNDDEIKQPYGTLDPTGQYFLWLSNVGGNRLDAFLVHVPAALIVSVPADIVAPTVEITSPATDPISGDTTLAVAAGDDTGVAGVQFKLDGMNLGAQVTSAPFSLSWNSATAANGVHVLTAVACDAAGNFTVAWPVIVTVNNTAEAPSVSGILLGSITENSATVQWTTNHSATSEIEYGPTPAYGQSLSNPAMVTTHIVTLDGLASGTTYHFRVRSRNGSGLSTASEDGTFTTPAPPAPVFRGVSAILITSNSAVIAWTVNQHTRGRVEFGKTSSYGRITDWDHDWFVVQTQALRNLTPGTTYHFRVHVMGRHGQPATTRDYTFTTRKPPAPRIHDLDIDASSTGAMIRWRTDLRSTSQAEYGASRSYGNTTKLDRALVTHHSERITGLTPGTLYHVRVKSTSADGLTTISSDYTFKTPPRKR